MWFATNASATSFDQQVLVKMTDGSSTIYTFDENTKIEFKDKELILTTSLVDIQLPVEKLAKFEYIKTTGIGSITDETTKISVYQRDRLIFIENVLFDTPITVYSGSGITIYSSIAKGGEINTISIDSWSPGLYIVKLADKSFKIVTR